MRQTRLALGALALCGLPLCLEQSAHATNHLIILTEVAAGVNGNSQAQFVEIQMESTDQNLWGPQAGDNGESRAMLVFFDGVGNKTGEFKFPANAPTGSNRFVLVGTTAFRDLANVPDPDILIPPLVNAGSGRVCFRDNPLSQADENGFSINECVAYGSFPASLNENNGTPVAGELPILGTNSLRRRELAGGEFDHNSDNSLAWFHSASPNPTRNGTGAPGTIPPASQIEQGRNLFANETFGGNGRTCASCHVLALNGGMPPQNVVDRFGNLSNTFDPLFISEQSMNLNTLTVSFLDPENPVVFSEGTVLTGSGSGGQQVRVKVLTAVSSTSYLVYGGVAPVALATNSNISDGTRTARVASIVAGNLNQLESPTRMRTSNHADFATTGRALILENIDGFTNPEVFRKSPHVQNLRHTGPVFGLSDDISSPNGANAALNVFSRGAVVQHFPRRLQRVSGTDFREPTTAELDAMTAFMMSLESIPGTPGDTAKFSLDNFARTAAQKQGRADFNAPSSGCNVCHTGTVLTGPKKASGVVTQAINGTGAQGDNLPLDQPPGTTPRKFAVPGLFNVKNNAPFFHDNSALDLRKAVEFYRSTNFQTAPDGFATNISDQQVTNIVAFLDGLVARPYVVREGTVDVSRAGTVVDFGSFGVTSGATTKTLTVVNTDTARSVQFPAVACRIGAFGSDLAGEFPAPDCTQLNNRLLGPGQSVNITVRFDPTSAGVKTAILEILAPDPTGVDLKGTGSTVTGVVDTFSVDSPGTPPGWTFVRGGSFSVSAGQLRMTTCTTCSGAQGNILVNNFTLPQSFTLTVGGMVTATTGANDDFSVIFNFQDANNYYYASFNESDDLSGADDPQTNGIFKVVNGTRTQIRDFTRLTVPGGELAPLHAVRIEKVKSTIRVFVNDIFYGSVVDSTFTAGRAGVGSLNNSGRFDDFVVKTQLLSEDFTATTPNNFAVIRGGTFAISSGAFRLTSPANATPNGNIAVHNTVLPSGSYELFVDGLVVSNTGSTFDDFSIIFNFQDANNYYFASFNESDNGDTNGVFRVQGGVFTQIIDFGTNVTPPSVNKIIRIQRTGSTIRVLRENASGVIEQLGATVFDATFNGGKVGVGSRNDAAVFDNIFVETP